MTANLSNGNALSLYDGWDKPDVIISDGAYGVGGFLGDPYTPDDLADWYAPHIQAWTKCSKASTSLWFWNTEIGWANVHPILKANGWDYVETIIWDKGLSHIAGNVNSKTIRQFPVVTEVSALYRKRLVFPAENGSHLDVKQWLRSEWMRSGLPLYKANEACGTKNAATRKYLTQDHLWYWPSGAAVEAMANYATIYGKRSPVPYFSLDGRTSVSAKEWDSLRSVWNHEHGQTNVWKRDQLTDSERIRRQTSNNYSSTGFAHLNQKPIEFMKRQILSTTLPGDNVWEPFGGLGSASLAAQELGRNSYYAEIDSDYFGITVERLKSIKAQIEIAKVA